jgi:penicillin-binding protein 2
MTQKIYTPTRGRIALSFFLFITLFLIGNSSNANAQRRTAKSKAPAARPQAKKTTGKTARETRATNNRRGATAKNTRTTDRRANNRTNSRDTRSSRKATASKRNERPVSRRESRAESRRAAAQRRREAIEAARRAEAARQAAIARQRAIDQGLRDETAANIARDETTGEDLEVRRIAVAALGNQAGTVVVMDPKTGQIYTVVNQEWALRRGYKPCSTIKLVTGVAGLCENVIDPLTQVSGRGIDLTDSLAYSDNPFFQSVGGKVGFERIMTYARDLGLGERTGINYANESPGRVPLFKSGYAVNHMCSHGDDFEVTPVQLATMVSAIANGGDLLMPHVPRTPQETVKFKKEVRRKVNVPEETLRRLVPGMIGAVNYGTGKMAYDPLQTVAGKTGTCIGQGGWLGLFTSYAPVNDPKLAVVVVTRGSGARGRTAAAIAGKIYRGLNTRFGTPTNMRYAATPETPRPKVDAKSAVVSDELEADEAERAGVDPTDETNTSATTTDATRGNVKSVLMPVPSKQNETKTATPAPAASPAPQDAQRPRRVMTGKP